MKIEKDNIINLQYIEKEVMRRKFIAINTYRKMLSNHLNCYIRTRRK